MSALLASDLHPGAWRFALYDYDLVMAGYTLPFSIIFNLMLTISTK
jgi:hypothetical protein